MSTRSYRTPPDEPGSERPARGDRDLVLVYLLVWIWAAAIVIATVAKGDRFGTKATLALMASLVLPFVIWRAAGRSP